MECRENVMQFTNGCILYMFSVNVVTLLGLVLEVTVYFRPHWILEGKL